MTERKPPDLTFESWIDKQVREADERGEFSQLPGAGKPIPGAGTSVEEDWWLRDYLRREGVRADGMLPESLVLRRDIEQIRETVRELDSERAVRAAVSELNQRIVRWVRTPTPPHVPIAPVDTDEVVTRWRADRAPARRAQSSPAVEPPVSASGKRRWWQRRG
ncbi:DUF1992 domain-containing protein [Nocardia cyriacigeorgica]|uniref:DUF1992 domain-containing protein n=1 Tax=Nocardia cyriacigeorgica TaxID=135487 RepID=A0A6P1D665_9NOCA|nr:DUF1992 domain-containing protein [Nocardia cyriacigeorgica]NEW37514.1 DUF1992 domain-containing protein [Nocardia cyriacigeorgica]NEW44991.1 DUF1992 domain-containing protein [Nocardia cyriacigeorgica]NEW49098.1 DUF1992 domain-containing protein [Nocardia cyriacigeorgica]NEW56700.1 DUF1992 domain-containing protein [Nocardia cyriacigeorgica]